MTWTLLVFTLVAGQPQVEAVKGFASREACHQAGVRSEQGWRRPWLCVEGGRYY